MSDFAQQLTAILPDLIRSAGAGGLTTAADLRSYESRVIDAVAGLEIRARGSRIFTGQLYGSPVDPTLGLEGDLFIETDVLDLYTFMDGVWIFLINLMPRTSAFVPVPANEYATHPAFSTEREWLIWLTQNMGSGTGTPNITPAAPTAAFNASLRMLTATAPTGYTLTDLEYRHGSNGTYQPYAAVAVDANAHAANEWQFRVKAATGRNASVPANSPTIGAASAPGPTIASLTPDTAPTGSTVTLTGTNLTGTTAVAVNGVAVSVFNVVNATTLTFTVPGNATTGAVSLTTAAGSATGPVFTVGAHDPIVASITPASGVVGTRVTIAGGYFLSSTTVTFGGGVTAPIESIFGDGQIKVLVPDGATTGPILLSNGGASVPTPAFTVSVYNPPFVYYPADSTNDRQADYFPAEASWGNANNGVYEGGSARYLNAGTDGYAEMYTVASGYAIDLPILTAAQYTEMQVDNGPRIPLGIPAGSKTLYTEVYRSPYLGTSLKRLRIYGVAAANILAIVDRVRFLDIDPADQETYLTPGYAQTGYVA